MANILLENMEFYAYHGCFSEEQIIGNHFLMDVSFEYNTSKAEESDFLEDTIDYQAIYEIIKKEMAIPSKLLEHVGRRIITAIEKQFPDVSQIHLKITKCNPPIGGKMSGVSVEF